MTTSALTPSPCALPPSLDRLLARQPGRSITAVRNVPGTLSVFDSHFPRFPVLPGVLLLDSMAAAAALVLDGPDHGWALSGAEMVRFRHFVRPGDEVIIEAKLLQRTDADALLTVTATVEGRAVATARRLRLAPVGLEPASPEEPGAPALQPTGALT